MRKGWVMKTLGDIGTIFNGNSINGNVKKEKYLNIEDGLPFIATKDVGYDNIVDYDNGIRIPFEEKNNFKVAPINTILICAEGGSAGRKICFVDREVCFGNKLFALVTKNDINSRFVYYWYFSDNFQKDFKTGLAGIIGGVSLNKFREIQIPIPPLAEQQQIVSILDEAFAAIDQAKQNLQRNLQNAKEFFQSELNNIFENKGEDWNEKLLGEVTSKIGSGATPRGGHESYKTEGISLIRSMNVHDRFFKEKNLAFIDDKQAEELSNVVLEENDVLLNITGASVARCCVIPKEYLPGRVNQHVSILRAKKEIVYSYFLNLLLVSKFYKDQLLETGDQGSTRQAITKAQLQNFAIQFPSLKEQKKIVNQLDTLSVQTEALEQLYQKKLDNLEELKKSILQKAFSGELTMKQNKAIA